MKTYHYCSSDAREECVVTGSIGTTRGFGPAGPPGSALEQDESMALSVTRHALKPLVSNAQFLACGVDTLDLGLFVQWDSTWETKREALEQKKEASQGTNGLLDSTEDGREFLHLPSAKPPNYRYQLQFKEYRLFISKSATYKKSPNVYVSITAASLWHLTLTDIEDLLQYDIAVHGGTISRIQPSRVDLCADFRLTPPPSLSFIQEQRVSDSRKCRTYMDGDILETYTSGSPTSPVQVRIYDKGKEIQKTDKQWFLPIWGVESAENVWRVEFQLRRTFLHQYRISTLDDLQQKIGTIWEYLTTEWFSLRIPDDPKTIRRTVHPWWRAVQDCRSRFGEICDTRRIFTSESSEPIEKTLSHIIGRMTTIAAYKGISQKDGAIEYLGKLLQKRVEEDKFAADYAKKSIRHGFRRTDLTDAEILADLPPWEDIPGPGRYGLDEV